MKALISVLLLALLLPGPGCLTDPDAPGVKYHMDGNRIICDNADDTFSFQMGDYQSFT